MNRRPVTPPPLRAGSVIAVAAPASPLPRAELFRGLAWLSTRYRLRIDTRVLAREGYLAGSDEARADVLAKAMRDPEVEAIVCGRGGYGSMRILDRLPWDDFVKAPKHIVGFSDITALHAIANMRGVTTVHGPNVTGLGRSITPAERLSLIDCLEGRPRAPLEGLQGPFVGGNLALVQAMAAAGRFLVPDGATIVLEDVTERPYRIDRMLISLALGGYFDHAAAVVLGQFTQCEPGPDGVTIESVLDAFRARLRIPVHRDAPFGHGAPNFAFQLG